MVMAYDGALVMPSNYAVMEQEEMTYVDGGSYNMDCSKRFLSKYNCNFTASWLVSTGRVTGMTSTAVAKEIFAHVYSYYNYVQVAAVFGVAVAAYCYKKAADGISIMDGGDTGLRKAVYDSFWSIFPDNPKYK